MTMWGVDNIKIKACDFSNISPDANTVQKLGVGIISEDASFYVGCGGICTYDDPCCESSPSSFENLFKAINAKGAKSVKTYKVDNTFFINCQYGIWNEGVNYFTITRNIFNIGYSPDFSESFSIGIVNYNGTKFRIEENRFGKSSNANLPITVGTFMENTGKDNNEIYNNRFSDMFISNWANGNNNVLPEDENLEVTGLAYFCNKQYTSAHGDIVSDFGSGLREYHFVPGNDVDPGKSAGNSFTNDINAGLGAESSFYNHAVGDISYVYGSGINQKPEYSTPEPKFVAISASSINMLENGCSSKLIEKTKEQLTHEFNNEKLEWETKMQEWKDRMNFEGESEVLQLIASSGQNDQILKDKLLQASPFCHQLYLKP